ncbi:AfsR/SARP family transcriptional regulator [Amycolatopsis mongoliensis]|uniref:AfsR/SARP family transcriptional regulator n=1 Tax=Amycolatopsis mongoliensis TaxID=715475 RepID=A0A9Y2JPZ6_9PSEU|nr:AfsR/SARP family transcriptional regulator [Amycolatopsis sp. 4-36]WIY01272.1 AfsR/SARP family transcriptional regulator [Amycolatopsis sp. 4-36]
MTDAMRFEVLGPVRAWRGDAEIELGPPQQRAALAVLPLQEGTPLSPSQLVSALWGGAEPRAAVGVVRSYVSRLRHAGVPIESVGGGYAIRPASLDVTEFQRLLSSARPDSLRAALRLWHGTPLAGVNGDYAEAARVRLAELRLTAREALAEADIAAGRHGEAVADLAELIAEQPLRERPRELQMLALYRSGRQAEALDAYARTQRLLESELGLDPGPELQEMQRRILAADPSLTPVSRPSQLPPDLPEFVGRRSETSALSAALTRSNASVPVLGIEGLAAIGKTTLAVHVGHTVDFPDGRLFLDMSASADPLSELLHGIGVTNLPASPSERASLWRTRTTGRRLLVVLDNARPGDDIHSLLPGPDGPALMITARRRLFDLPHAHWTKLGALDLQDSVALLSRVLGAERVSRQPAETRTLASRTAGLPQVLQAIAARLAARPSWTMAEALDRVGRPAPGSPATPPECQAIEKPYESALAELSPWQARAFELLSAFPAFSTATASEVLDLPPAETATLLESLVDAHLLNPSGPDRYSYQEPVRMFARSRAESMQQIRNRPIMPEPPGRLTQTPLNEGAGQPYTLSSAGPSGGMADALA